MLFDQFQKESLVDANIREVLDDLDDTIALHSMSDFSAPELQHSLHSMETCNLDIWTSVLNDQPSKPVISLLEHRGHAVTTIYGGQSTIEVTTPMRLLPSWSEVRSGWAVLVPNRFFHESSFHTGYTPSWTQGNVIGEYKNDALGQQIVVCNLGGHDCEKHLEAKDCRIANGQDVRAEGSEGGHGYGWQKRKLCLNMNSEVFLPSSSAECGNTILLDKDELHEEHAQQQGRPISDYEEPSDVVGADGTQDSTARTIFPT